jgi:hypothetical protein
MPGHVMIFSEKNCSGENLNNFEKIDTSKYLKNYGS